MSDWNAKLYQKFERERSLPAKDLANAIPLNECSRIVDLGCGTGNSTRVLRERFPKAQIIGVDSSENMLATAAKEHPDIQFLQLDADEEMEKIPGRFDLVFSNACAQWIPGHERLFQKWMTLLNPHGVLAVQIPLQKKHPMHQIISAVAGSEKWRGYFKKPRTLYHLMPEEYHDVFVKISTDFSMWETVYFHRMPSHDSILQWYKGTGLRPYLSVLNEPMASQFEQDVLKAVISHYPIRKNGEILFEFPRLFLIAVK